MAVNLDMPALILQSGNLLLEPDLTPRDVDLFARACVGQPSNTDHRLRCVSVNVVGRDPLTGGRVVRLVYLGVG